MIQTLRGLVIVATLCSAAQLAAEPAVKLAAEPAVKPAKGDPNELICEKMGTIGSRVATKKVCATRAEWAEKRKLDREAVEQAQRMGNAPCQTTGASAGAGQGRPSC